VKHLILQSIHAYKKYSLSLVLTPGLIIVPQCRFHPTCSEYALQAVEQYGAAKGVLKTVSRIARCHPFAKGGVDLP
jgi:putative membrane protein insertion efficiency factor